MRELTQAGLVLPGRPGVGPSDREIAKKLEIPSGTLRYRIRRLYSSGILKGSSAFPNPNLLGLKAGAYTVDVSPTHRKTDAVNKLKLIDGAMSIHNFIGSLVWITFVYENDEELSKKLDMMKNAAGAEGVLSSIPYPPCPVSLTQNQAELLLYLTKYGLTSYRELAKKLGVSVRTAERRLSDLVRNTCLLSLPRVNYSAMTGCVPADLLVLFRDLEALRKVQPSLFALLGDQIILAALWDVVGMCSLVLPNVSSVSEIAEKVKLLEGVVAARVDIVKEHIELTETYGAYIEQRMISRGLVRTPRSQEERHLHVSTKKLKV